jgi:hypothetical protein
MFRILITRSVTWPLILTLLFASACVRHTIYTKQNIEFASLEKDATRCRGQVATLIEGPHAHAFATPAEAIGVALGSAIVAGMNSSAERDLFTQCMAKRGYRGLDLSSDEHEIFTGLHSDVERTVFLRKMAETGGSLKPRQ